MAIKTAILTLEIEYDDTITDEESLASAFDVLLGTATSSDGVLDEYGNPEIGEFFPMNPDLRRRL